MPLTQVGLDAVHHGKKLFPLLCNLKNFGKGRIIYSTLEQQHSEPSFYRILLAQPEMDDEMQFGRVVAERVYRGKRFLEPFNMAGKQTKFPDYRLVPKDEEQEFCRWDEVVDYDPKLHAPLRGKYMEMPPLLKLVIERNLKAKGEKITEDSLLLPAYKIYEGDVRLSDEIESNDMSVYLTEEFATHKTYDIMSLIPYEQWNEERVTSVAGHRVWPSYSEEVNFGWDVIQQREEEAAKDKTE